MSLSLGDTYQTVCKEKRETDEKVIYATHANTIRTDLESVISRLEKLQRDIAQIFESIAKLETIDMQSFLEKHTRMKENHNTLVQNVVSLKTDSSVVITDLTRRLNNVEARLSM
jgi:uncharacterized protein (UPF0335 family)